MLNHTFLNIKKNKFNFVSHANLSILAVFIRIDMIKMYKNTSLNFNLNKQHNIKILTEWFNWGRINNQLGI